jgi:hypothetical protein
LAEGIRHGDGPVAGRFGRVEPRRTARAFVLGLLSNIERKNCWWLAAYAGHGGPQAMLRLVAGTRWCIEESFQAAKGMSAWTSTKSAAGHPGTCPFRVAWVRR